MKQTWLFLSATKSEWNKLKKIFDFKRMSSVDRPLWQLFFKKNVPPSSKEIFLCQLGIGPDMAQESFQKILKYLSQKPNFVLHFGLSGALIESLKIGDIIIAQEFYELEKPPIKLMEVVNGKINKILRNLPLHFTYGPQLTSREVLKTPDEKRKAFQSKKTIAVDMESYPIASRCFQEQIPYLSIRAIFDELETDLTLLDEAKTIDKEGNIQTLNMIKAIAINPKLLISLPQFQQTINKGNEALFCVIKEIIERW